MKSCQGHGPEGRQARTASLAAACAWQISAEAWSSLSLTEPDSFHSEEPSMQQRAHGMNTHQCGPAWIQGRCSSCRRPQPKPRPSQSTASSAFRQQRPLLITSSPAEMKHCIPESCPLLCAGGSPASVGLLRLVSSGLSAVEQPGLAHRWHQPHAPASFPTQASDALPGHAICIGLAMLGSGPKASRQDTMCCTIPVVWFHLRQGSNLQLQDAGLHIQQCKPLFSLNGN